MLVDASLFDVLNCGQDCHARFPQTPLRIGVRNTPTAISDHMHDVPPLLVVALNAWGCYVISFKQFCPSPWKFDMLLCFVSGHASQQSIVSHWHLSNALNVLLELCRIRRANFQSRMFLFYFRRGGGGGSARPAQPVH
jgi:hypothetical protein